MLNNLSVQFDISGFSLEQQRNIERAFVYSQSAHEGQRRQSGEPYLVHPLAVAGIVADWGLDADAIQAALLHDVVEDTPFTLEDISREFGAAIAGLVDGLTKLGDLPKPAADSSRREISNENLRKLLLATSRDYRVILVKLADRLHNLRTLGHLDQSRRTRIARESLEVYAPLADRLGMGALKSELEDLAFRYAFPEAYADLVPAVAVSAKQSERYLAVLKRHLKELLVVGGVEPGSIEGRSKHLYSIYKKLAKSDGDLSKIYDLFAIRIIVPNIPSCYQALGLIHQKYKPLIYRIKDYIAVPKPNGYQSLHTTVFAEDGHITEIQIRTPEMHVEAERGLSAHFFYDAQKSSQAYKSGKGAANVPEQLAWVNQLANIEDLANSSEAIEPVRLELFRDRIFVFSPKGDLYELPEQATPIDFAFAIHSDIGLRTLGAKVNGKMVPLDTHLENRDVVEIMTKREPAPNRDWLGFVQTSIARNRIRSWFRSLSREANISTGKSELEAELRLFEVRRVEELPPRQLADALDSLHIGSVEDLYAAIGDGSVSVRQAVRRLVPQALKPASVPVVRRPEATGGVLIEGTELPYTIAVCCQPVFPQAIIGYVTRGKGVTVHRIACPNLPIESDRYASARWETLADAPERLVCRLQLKAANRIGLLSDITGFLSRNGLNIGSIRSQNNPDNDNESEVSFALEVADLLVLSDVIDGLKRVRGITAVKRV